MTMKLICALAEIENGRSGQRGEQQNVVYVMSEVGCSPNR